MTQRNDTFLAKFKNLDIRAGGSLAPALAIAGLVIVLVVGFPILLVGGTVVALSALAAGFVLTLAFMFLIWKLFHVESGTGENQP